MSSRGLGVLAAPLLVCTCACGARTPLDVPSDASSSDASPSDAPAGDAPTRCPDGGPLELAYALDDVGGLHRYDPLTGQAVALGTPDCNDDNVQWTMTASSEYAYIVYTDWTIYAVSLATLECTQTPFQPGQLGLESEFGVAIVGTGPAERLYVYGVPSDGSGPILAVSDTTSFVLTKVGDIVFGNAAPAFPVNLTADANGRLYAFAPTGQLQVIDPVNAAVLQSFDTGVTTTSTWATLTYGPDLFLWVEGSVVGFDLATGLTTGDRDAGIDSVGAASFLACPGP